MIVDANLLLYARNADDARGERAADWLEGVLNGPVRVGLPWQTLTAFLRIATNPRVFSDPLDPGDAWRQVEAWLAAPAAWVPVPTARHGEVLGHLITDLRVTAGLVSDAHLAALALEHGVGVWSTDRDFTRFPGLRFEDPLS